MLLILEVPELRLLLLLLLLGLDRPNHEDLLDDELLDEDDEGRLRLNKEDPLLEEDDEVRRE